MPDSEWWDINQAASYLKVSESWLYKQTRGKSGIPFAKCGRMLRFRKDALDSWMEKGGDHGVCV